MYMYTNRYYTILVLYVTGIDEYVYWLINIIFAVHTRLQPNGMYQYDVSYTVQYRGVYRTQPLTV